MFVITGATGKLGQHVVSQLLAKVPATRVAVAVRNPDKAHDLRALGVEVRTADYAQPSTLAGALRGAEKVLLISSSEVGQRLTQHQAVVAAAKQAGVGLLVYTSILRADSSPLALASEHKATEQAIVASGLPHVFLRNGWYNENYSEHLAPALHNGAFVGSAGQGRIAAAARADYAAAAVAVLTGEGHANQVYELGGDEPFTMAQLAAEVSRQTGKTLPYHDVPEAELKTILIDAGLPEPYAALLADSDAGAAQGGLDDSSKTLSRLIGRGTTPLRVSVAEALARHSA